MLLPGKQLKAQCIFYPFYALFHFRVPNCRGINPIHILVHVKFLAFCFFYNVDIGRSSQCSTLLSSQNSQDVLLTATIHCLHVCIQFPFRTYRRNTHCKTFFILSVLLPGRCFIPLTSSMYLYPHTFLCKILNLCMVLKSHEF